MTKSAWNRKMVFVPTSQAPKLHVVVVPLVAQASSRHGGGGVDLQHGGGRHLHRGVTCGRRSVILIGASTSLH